MDYAQPEKRKSKNDKKKKRQKGYRKGGKFRSMNVEETGSKKKD